MFVRPSPSVASASSASASATRSSSSRAPAPARRLLARPASSRFDGSQNMNTAPKKQCPVCQGTGWKPCGQCDGTGVNQSDLFAGKFKKGDACWLCNGQHGSKTMCGNCVDLTDTF